MDKSNSESSEINARICNKWKISCAVCKCMTVFKCSECKSEFYCSRDHQRLHWRKHKQECIRLRSIRKKSIIKTKSIAFGPDDAFVDAMNLSCYEELKSNVLKALTTVGICIIDNYIHNDIADSIRGEIEALHLQPGLFQKAEQDYEKRMHAYRDDKVAWITGQEKLCEKLQVLIQSFDTLVTSLKLYSSNRERVSHKSHLEVSCFSLGSSGYKIHVDNPNNNGLLLAAKFYCNLDYNRERDGGISRFYLGSCKKFVDVEPKFNRAVFHWCDKRILHEVLPCSRKIFSLTSWYFGPVTNLLKRDHKKRTLSSNSSYIDKSTGVSDKSFIKSAFTNTRKHYTSPQHKLDRYFQSTTDECKPFKRSSIIRRSISSPGAPTTIYPPANFLSTELESRKRLLDINRDYFNSSAAHLEPEFDSEYYPHSEEKRLRFSTEKRSVPGLNGYLNGTLSNSKIFHPEVTSV